MKTLLLLTLALSALAQSIDAGGSTDTGYTDGLVWAPGTAGYVDLGGAPWTTLRFSRVANGVPQPFSYQVPEPNGFYRVRFSLMEPNKTGPGQRIFSITANGETSAALDLFQLAGLRGQYTYDMFVPVNNGMLTIVFRATLGNAVVSAIDVAPFLIPDLTFDRRGNTGPMIPIVDDAGKLQAAWMLNGSVTLQPQQAPIIAFGFPNMRFGVQLLRRADGKYAFPGSRPNPANSIGVYRNGIHMSEADYGLSWSDPNQLPDALAVPSAQPSDSIIVDYVVGGVPAIQQ